MCVQEVSLSLQRLLLSFAFRILEDPDWYGEATSLQSGSARAESISRRSRKLTHQTSLRKFIG